MGEKGTDEEVSWVEGTGTLTVIFPTWIFGFVFRPILWNFEAMFSGIESKAKKDGQEVGITRKKSSPLWKIRIFPIDEEGWRGAFAGGKLITGIQTALKRLPRGRVPKKELEKVTDTLDEKDNRKIGVGGFTLFVDWEEGKHLEV